MPAIQHTHIAVIHANSARCTDVTCTTTCMRGCAAAGAGVRTAVGGAFQHAKKKPGDPKRGQHKQTGRAPRSCTSRPQTKKGPKCRLDRVLASRTWTPTKAHATRRTGQRGAAPTPFPQPLTLPQHPTSPLAEIHTHIITNRTYNASAGGARDGDMEEGANATATGAVRYR